MGRPLLSAVRIALVHGQPHGLGVLAHVRSWVTHRSATGCPRVVYVLGVAANGLPMSLLWVAIGFALLVNGSSVSLAWMTHGVLMLVHEPPMGLSWATRRFGCYPMGQRRSPAAPGDDKFPSPNQKSFHASTSSTNS